MPFLSSDQSTELVSYGYHQIFAIIYYPPHTVIRGIRIDLDGKIDLNVKIDFFLSLTNRTRVMSMRNEEVRGSRRHSIRYQDETDF